MQERRQDQSPAGAFAFVVAGLVPVALAILACGDPVYSINGTVQEGAAGAPLVGAKVTKTCPKTSPETATTDASGHFEFGGVGGSFDADKCTLSVAATGYTPQTIPSTSACLRSTHLGNTGKPCGPAEGKITLWSL